MTAPTIAETAQETDRAEKRIRNHIIETRLEYSPFLSSLVCAGVYLKCENLQVTGSFKLRGALNKILSLSRAEKERGVTTASTGNHGSAVAYALARFHIKGSIYLPVNAEEAKVEIIRTYHTGLIFYGRDCLEAELKAKETAVQNHQVYISPYNDMKIIGGQGTIAVELMRQLEKIDAVICPVGGGGLIAGIASRLKSWNKEIEIIGAQPQNCPFMYAAFKTGNMQDVIAQPTIADGVAGALEADAVTLALCRACVDDFILVSEEEIEAAMESVISRHFMPVEGAGALAVAALIKEKERFKNKNVVLVISGGKISLEKLRSIRKEPPHRRPLP